MVGCQGPDVGTDKGLAVVRISLVWETVGDPTGHCIQESQRSILLKLGAYRP